MSRFPFVGRDHLDSIPRTTIQKSTVRTFTDALLATNAEIGVDFDVTKGRMVFVRDPKHAIFHWTIRDASRRPGAARTAFGDDCKLLRLLFPRCVNTL